MVGAVFLNKTKLSWENFSLSNDKNTYELLKWDPDSGYRKTMRLSWGNYNRVLMSRPHNTDYIQRELHQVCFTYPKCINRVYLWIWSTPLHTVSGSFWIWSSAHWWTAPNTMFRTFWILWIRWCHYGCRWNNGLLWFYITFQFCSSYWSSGSS